MERSRKAQSWQPSLQVSWCVGVNAEKAVFTSAFTKSPLFEDMLGGRVSTDRSFDAEDYATHLLVIEVSEKFGSDRPDGTTEMRTDDLRVGY